MSAIGPGDYVECVDAEPPVMGSWADDAGARVFAGKVYRVEEVGVCKSFKYGFGPGVRVDGLEAQYPIAGLPYSLWPLARFRPIYRRDESLTERLLQPLPADVEQLNPDRTPQRVGA